MSTSQFKNPGADDYRWAIVRLEGEVQKNDGEKTVKRQYLYNPGSNIYYKLAIIEVGGDKKFVVEGAPETRYYPRGRNYYDALMQRPEPYTYNEAKAEIGELFLDRVAHGVLFPMNPATDPLGKYKALNKAVGEYSQHGLEYENWKAWWELWDQATRAMKEGTDEDLDAVQRTALSLSCPPAYAALEKHLYELDKAASGTSQTPGDESAA